MPIRRRKGQGVFRQNSSGTSLRPRAATIASGNSRQNASTHSGGTVVLTLTKRDAETRRVIRALADHDAALSEHGRKRFGLEPQRRTFDNHEIALRWINRNEQPGNAVHLFLDGGLVTALDTLNIAHPFLLNGKPRLCGALRNDAAPQRGHRNTQQSVR